MPITIRGLNTLRGPIQAFEQEAESLLDDVERQIREGNEQYTPVDTGELRDSLIIERTPTGLRAIWTATYAAIVNNRRNFLDKILSSIRT